MKKLEIIIDKSYLNRLLNKFELVGVKGYSAIDIARSMGPTNEMGPDGVLLSNNMYVLSLIDESIVENLKTLVMPLINETGGIIITSTPEFTMVK